MSGWLADDSLEAARAELETNVFGPLLMSRAFAPVLAGNGGGAIINVLSVLSFISLPESGTYCASKAAAWSLTNALRAELAGQHTHVIGVHVGLMDTDMARSFDAPKIRPEEVAHQALAALESGEMEVLADEMSRQVKRNLSAPRAAYLNAPAWAARQPDETAAETAPTLRPCL
jgi:short-subunit dehydrogenase